MPGRNGTGPMGQGPMTGRGLGRCSAGNNGQNKSKNTTDLVPGRGMGNGRGRGINSGSGKRGW